ncbi:MAG TPA: hypothetical protein PKB06_02770, partial [Actinotalea sp.]|nr:hypothetical protein [Actinotalea sp.]
PVGLRGTTVAPDDPPRLLRLVQLLTAERRPDVLLVDDLGTVVDSLARVPRGAADDLVARVLAARLALAVAGTQRDRRLVDPPGLLVELGGDPPLGDRPPVAQPPGRGVTAGAACQVATPSAAGAPAPPRGAAPLLALAELPERVTWADVTTHPLRPQGGAGPTASGDHSRRLVVGLGGDQAGPVEVDLSRGLLVVGPAGSGRSSVAALVGALAGATCFDPVQRPTAGQVVVLDDADLVLRDRPDLDELVAGWVRATEGGDRSAPRPVLTVRTDRAAVAYRGAVGALRSGSPVLVLEPGAPGSAEAAGVDLSTVWTPTTLRGRAVLADRGTLVRVQVIAPR